MGSGYDPIADANGNIADDASTRSDHTVVVQLDGLLIDLGFERMQLCGGGIECGARLVEILFADDAGIGEAADALVILLSPLQLRDLGGAGIVLTLERGLLLCRIDLHHGSAIGNVFAGMNEYLGNDAFDLRHDHGGITGL